VFGNIQRPSPGRDGGAVAAADKQVAPCTTGVPSVAFETHTTPAVADSTCNDLHDLSTESPKTLADYTPPETNPGGPLFPSPTDDGNIFVPSGPFSVPETVAEAVVDVGANSEHPLHLRSASSSHGSSDTPPSTKLDSHAGSTQVLFR
jgi:hypothetical protein